MAIALDNCAALHVTGDQYRIIQAKPTAHAYKFFWKDGIFFEEQNVAFNKFNMLKKGH